MYTDCHQLYLNRRGVIVDFLRDNAKVLREWDIREQDRLPFLLLSEKLEKILLDEFDETLVPKRP